MKSKLGRNFWISVVASALSVQCAKMSPIGAVSDLLIFLYFICAVVGGCFAAGWCFLAVREKFGKGWVATAAGVVLSLVLGSFSFLFLSVWAWIISPPKSGA